MDKKENFYVFLDIDGVLWDWVWRLDQIDKGKIKNKSFISEFKPKSVSALDNLLERLNEKYDTKLVISSTWRSNLEFTEETLKQNGFKYNGPLYSTPITGGKRGEEILQYLSDKPKGKILIIDDEYNDFKKYFKPEQIIKTSLFEDSLSQKHIDNWLDKSKVLEDEATFGQ
ncbi:MAG: hypothetical protein IJX17_01840 [Clostridia bacterium]|nr:hypothetical protein [Clostridia bacterium]